MQMSWAPYITFFKSASERERETLARASRLLLRVCCRENQWLELCVTSTSWRGATRSKSITGERVREIKKHVREKRKRKKTASSSNINRRDWETEPEIPTIDVWLRSFFFLLFLSFFLYYLLPPWRRWWKRVTVRDWNTLAHAFPKQFE